MRLTRRRLAAAVAVLAALLLMARVAAALYADFAWYEALGATALWQAKVVNTVLLRGAAWVAGTLVVFANLYAVRGSVLKLIVPRRVANLQIEAEVPGRLLVGGAAVVAAGVGALLMLAQDRWTTLAAARYTRPFGESDNYFQHDLVFWTTWLPLERAWYTWAQATLVVVSVMVVTLYALTASLRWERGALHVAPYVRRHLSVLGALLLVLLAWGYRLERYLLVVDGGSNGFFGYAEQGSLGPLLVLSVLTVACASLVLWAGYTGQTRIAFGGVTLVIVLALGLQHLTPALLRWHARDLPARRSVEPYAGTRAGFTQRAYGIRDVLDASDSTTRFVDAGALAGRVTLWDEPAVVAAAERAGRRRVAAGSVGWQAGEDGRLLAVVPVRDEGAPRIDDRGAWLVGIVPAASTDAATLSNAVPRAVTRSLPPVLVHEGAIGYALAADPSRELAAPRLESGWQRMAHALAVQNLRIFFEPVPPSPAALLQHRAVRARVQRLAPTFMLGTAVTPLLHADSLHWAVHLYAASETYPLSQPLGIRDSAAGRTVETKYFRHAATAVVNAHTGAVLIVRAATAGPLATSWMDRFPELYRRPDGASPALRRLLPPALDAASAQASALATAGSAWIEAGALHVVDDDGSDSLVASRRPIPYAAPGTDGATAIALPLVGSADQRLRFLVVVTGGLAAGSRVISVASPDAPWSELQERVQSALDSVARDGGDAERLARGRVRVTPVGEGAALLWPLYAWRTDAEPTLRGLALAVEDSVRAARTLDELLRPAAAARAAPATAPGAMPDAAALFRAMREALRRADWRAFAEAFDALGRVLGEPAREPAGAPPAR